MKPSGLRSQDAIHLRILLLDDKGSEGENVKNLVRIIEGQFKSISGRMGMNVEAPSPEITTDPSRIYKIIEEEENLPDLIMCDLNLSKKGEGVKVARKITKQNYPTDVLLYSFGAFKPKKIEIPSRYGVVLIANGSMIGGYIEWLAWRALVKLSDPEYMRGLILSRATDTEVIIDECLTNLFEIKDNLRSHFKMGLLRTEGNGPINKYEVLRSAMVKFKLIEKIKPEEDKTLGKLRHINTKRNLVAHGRVESDGTGGVEGSE